MQGAGTKRKREPSQRGQRGQAAAAAASNAVQATAAAVKGAIVTATIRLSGGREQPRPDDDGAQLGTERDTLPDQAAASTHPLPGSQPAGLNGQSSHDSPPGASDHHIQQQQQGSPTEAAEGQGTEARGPGHAVWELWVAVGDLSKVVLHRAEGWLGAEASGSSVQGDPDTSSVTRTSSRLYPLLCLLLLAALLGSAAYSGARSSSRQSDAMAAVQRQVANLSSTLGSTVSSLEAAISSASAGWAANLSVVSAAVAGLAHNHHQSSTQIAQLLSSMEAMQSQVQAQQAQISHLSRLLGVRSASDCPSDGSSNDTSCVPGPVLQEALGEHTTPKAHGGYCPWIAQHITGPESALAVLGGTLVPADIIHHSPSALDTRPLARLYLVLYSFFRPVRLWGTPILPTAHSLTNAATLSSHASAALTAGLAQPKSGLLSPHSCPLPLHARNGNASINSSIGSTGAVSSAQLAPQLPSLPAAATGGGPIVVLRLPAPVAAEDLSAVTLVMPLPMYNGTEQAGVQGQVTQCSQGNTTSTDQVDGTGITWPASTSVHVLLQWAPDNSTSQSSSATSTSQAPSSAAAPPPAWVSLGRLLLNTTGVAAHTTAGQALHSGGTTTAGATSVQAQQMQPPAALRRAAIRWLGARGWEARTLPLPAPASTPPQGPGKAYVSHVTLMLHGATPQQPVCTPLIFLHGPSSSLSV